MNNEHIDDKLEALLRLEPDYMDGTDFCNDVQIAIEHRLRVRRQAHHTPDVMNSVLAVAVRPSVVVTFTVAVKLLLLVYT